MNDDGMWRPPARIRVLAVAIIRRGDEILVFEGADPSKPGTFYRPLGGAVEPGERAEEALHREFREELGADLAELRYLETLENLFTYDGAPGHEYVRVYEARLVDADLYNAEALTGHEDNGAAFEVVWLNLDRARRGEVPLYPDGLIELLDGRRNGA
jgi:ADP-ribose pyrophosphatase YjhB (NUDIX family)